MFWKTTILNKLSMAFHYYHYIVEALKRSFQDRNAVLTDPKFYDIPFEHLLSKSYAKELYDEISQGAEDVLTPSMGSDTAYATVVDEEGNAVSFIQSLYFEYGSGVVAGNTGILLQNRGSFFSLDPDHVNTLEPGKRTFHTLMPAMACKEGKPRILYGTQGGEGQPQTQTAIITIILKRTYLLNYKQMRKMKKGSFLINVGRGNTIVEDDLIAALNNGTIAGAALDVFEVEPLPMDHIFWQMDNVIVSPHTAYQSPKTFERNMNLLMQNLKLFSQGEPLLNIVDRQLGY